MNFNAMPFAGSCLAALIASGAPCHAAKNILLSQAPDPAPMTAPRPLQKTPRPTVTAQPATVPAATPAAAAPATSPEQSPVSSSPQNTTATFGDWVLRCRRADAPATDATCEVAQTLQVQGQGPIAEIAFGRPPGAPTSAAMRIVVVLPNNVTFGGPVQMSVDDKDKGADLTFRRCLPTGCFADTDARDDILTKWRSQTGRGRIAFKDGNNRDLALPFSFRGLAQALDAMVKR